MASSRNAALSKGDRRSVSLRLPREHANRYQELADEANLSLSDYLCLQLAQAHDLDVPWYIERARELHRAEQLSIAM